MLQISRQRTHTLTRLVPQFYLEIRNPSLERNTGSKEEGKNNEAMKVADGRKHK